MICRPCCDGRHESCPGGTRCGCQHRTDRRPATIGELHEHALANGPVVVNGWRVTAWPKEESNG